nr:serine/arginine repetitive matrix protein 1 [Drosophila bipectinata]
MADPYGPRQRGNYVTIQNEANGQSTCTEWSSSPGSLTAKPTQPSGVCLVDFKHLADRDRMVSGEESDYYPYTTFLRNTVVVRSGECCPPNNSFGYPTQRSKSSCTKKDKKSSSAHRHSNYQNYDNRSLLGHTDENLAYQPKRKSSRHSCDNINASNRSKDCSCPPPNPKPLPRPRPPSNPSNDCGCDPPQKRSRSRSKSRERNDDENCSCPRSGGQRALRSSSSHYMEYKDFRGTSPGPRNRNYSSEPGRKRRKSLTQRTSPEPESRGRRKHRTDPPDPSYYTRAPTAAAQQCSVRRHAHAHVRNKCPPGRAPPPPVQKGTCRSPTPCKPPPPPLCKNPKCKNNPAKKTPREKKRKPPLDIYAGDNGCGLPTDYIVHNRSQQECLRNPVTCSSGNYVRGGVLPHETHFEDQGQCPRKRTRSCDRCNRSIPACSNETMMEKPVQSYRYNCPENGKSSRKCTKCKARVGAEGAGRKCASAVANRCCPLCGVNTMMPKPSIRSMADPTNKKSRTIYKTMNSPICRPKKPKKKKYNLTICYTSKNRCLGGKNSHHMTSTLKKTAKAALSRAQFEPLKAIPYMEGSRLEQQFHRPALITKAYHALPISSGNFLGPFGQARNLAISPNPAISPSPNQKKIATPTPLVNSTLNHPQSRAGVVPTKPSIGPATAAPSASKKRSSSAAPLAALSVDPSPVKTLNHPLPRLSVEAKKTEAQKGQADRQPPKGQRSTPDNVTKSPRASTNLRSPLEAAKSLRPELEQPDTSLRSPLVKTEKSETPSHRKEKSLRFPSEEPDNSEKTEIAPPEEPDKSHDPPKSRRSLLHELRSESDGHSGPKSFRSPLNVHTSTCMEALEIPRTVQAQMRLPGYRAASYFGTEINPFYRSSFLKVRVSKEFLQTRLNPISQRTEQIKEEKKPKCRRSISLSTPSFCSSKNLMRMVFGDPFVRMGANPHYTFSWKKLFSFKPSTRYNVKAKPHGLGHDCQSKPELQHFFKMNLSKINKTMEHCWSSNCHYQNRCEAGQEDVEDCQSELPKVLCHCQKPCAAGQEEVNDRQSDNTLAQCQCQCQCRKPSEASQEDVDVSQSDEDLTSVLSQLWRQQSPAPKEPSPDSKTPQDPVRERTKQMKELKYRKKKANMLNFFSSKKVMRLVFGDPFIRMAANPHYTFSWRKIFSFPSKSNGPNRKKKPCNKG